MQKDIKNLFRLYLLRTKKKLPPLNGEDISTAYTLLRLRRSEYKLSQLRPENNCSDFTDDKTSRKNSSQKV